MKKCIKCGSHAFNLYAEKIDQGGLCDVHYWQGRAHRAEALAQGEQSSSQEPVAWDVHTEHCFQGEYQHCCKYGDGDDCTAKPTKEALAPTSTQCEVQPEQEPVAWIEHDDETAEPCPSCGKPLQSASGGGVVCSERCGYWFCF